MAKYAHKLIAKTAQEIAAAAYQDMAMDDDFYKMWPKEKVFVNKMWPTFVRVARETLANMLSMDTYDEKVKEEIAQALMLDRALPAGDTAVLPQTLSMVH
jgi:hypothetical protein